MDSIARKHQDLRDFVESDMKDEKYGDYLNMTKAERLSAEKVKKVTLNMTPNQIEGKVGEYTLLVAWVLSDIVDFRFLVTSHEIENKELRNHYKSRILNLLKILKSTDTSYNFYFLRPLIINSVRLTALLMVEQEIGSQIQWFEQKEENE